MEESMDEFAEVVQPDSRLFCWITVMDVEDG